MDKIMMAVTLITAIATLITAIVTFKTINEMKKAREQSRTEWLNDAFIKHEADVLLEFRVAYGDAQEAINFFLNNILTPLKMDIHIKEVPIISRERVIKYYTDINKLNNLYNKNQYIFRKHNLDKSISYLKCILDVAYMLPAKDLEFKLVEQNDSVKIYQLTNWNEVRQVFIFSAYFVFNQNKNVNELPNFQNMNMNEELDRFKGVVSSELRSLTFTLDNLTLYNDGTNQTNLNVRQSSFFPTLSK